MLLRSLIALGALGLSVISFAKPISHFPKTLDQNCDGGLAKLYDECGDQAKILKAAIQEAQKSNKNVLIVYGAEWCIWCHVFDKYLKGEIGQHQYAWRAEESSTQHERWDMTEHYSEKDKKAAQKLNQFAADNFVIAHIESDKTNGKAVLESVGVNTSKIYAVPTIIVLNKQGKFGAILPPASMLKGLEVRESGGEEYRGYDRTVLLQQLTQLKQKADRK